MASPSAGDGFSLSKGTVHQAAVFLMAPLSGLHVAAWKHREVVVVVVGPPAKMGRKNQQKHKAGSVDLPVWRSSFYEKSLMRNSFPQSCFPPKKWEDVTTWPSHFTAWRLHLRSSLRVSRNDIPGHLVAPKWYLPIQSFSKIWYSHLHLCNFQVLIIVYTFIHLYIFQL